MRALAHYALEPSRPEHERLVTLATAEADRVREACARAGLRPGQTALDIGCGPLGALPVLAEVVGPAGTVIGVDASAEALTAARGLLPAARFPNVRVIRSDVNALTPDALAPTGGADLAFCRCFLIHQRDPATTLRRIASLVRPGGAIVVHEPMDDCGPMAEPPVAALERVWRLVVEAFRRRGACADCARRGPALFAEAGLDLESQRGHLVLYAPAVGLGILRTGLLSVRPTLLEHGVASDEEIERLHAALEAAGAADLQWVSSPLMLEWIGRVRTDDARA